jgi:hypothetical protein
LCKRNQRLPDSDLFKDNQYNVDVDQINHLNSIHHQNAENYLDSLDDDETFGDMDDFNSDMMEDVKTNDAMIDLIDNTNIANDILNAVAGTEYGSHGDPLLPKAEIFEGIWTFMNNFCNDFVFSS